MCWKRLIRLAVSPQWHRYRHLPVDTAWRRQRRLLEFGRVRQNVCATLRPQVCRRGQGSGQWYNNSALRINIIAHTHTNTNTLSHIFIPIHTWTYKYSHTHCPLWKVIGTNFPWLYHISLYDIRWKVWEWQSILYADVCWRMLTGMLTYTDVCWRMQMQSVGAAKYLARITTTKLRI